MNEGWRSFHLFFGCIHFFRSVSSPRSVFPPSVLASAYDSQFIQTRQVAQSLWEWSPGSSQTSRFRPPALSARGASIPSRGTLSLPAWKSKGRQTPGLLHTTTAQSGSRWGNDNCWKRLYWWKASVSIAVFFVPSPGRSGEAKASDGHHHSGGQGLRGGAVCVSV